MKPHEKLIEDHYDRFSKTWYSNKVEQIKATPDEIAEFQAKVRTLRFLVRMEEEEKIVVANKDGNVNLLAMKLMPLVSRRKHPELWQYLVRHTAQDGTPFTFEPIISHYVCGCSDKELEASVDRVFEEFKAVDKTLADQTVYYHDTIRAEHNKSFDCDDAIPCNNPRKEPVKFYNKHTIGNWDCKGCLNIGTEIQSASDADVALHGASPKALEWCPRFLSIFRVFPIQKYVDMVATHNNRVCYAGLIHTEMTFEEIAETAGTKKVCGCTNAQLETSEALSAGEPCFDAEDLAAIRKQHNHGLDPVNADDAQIFCANPTFENINKVKTYVVITKKCDTCDYTFIEKKEYHQPEMVQGHQLLMALPEIEV